MKTNIEGLMDDMESHSLKFTKNNTSSSNQFINRINLMHIGWCNTSYYNDN